jgi:hypothetical protein
MDSHVIEKALEVWILQNLLNFSIMLGIFALGIAIIQKYYKSIEKKLTLRVSIEIDILLVFVVVTGYLVLNPDIMADIKIALPFVPIATILFAIALVLRLFHGGHNIKNPNFIRSLWFMFAANIINVIGFTFIMEAPSSAYLENHPSSFWTFLKTQLRSNTNPDGLELSQLTFYICFPILILVFIWGFLSAIRQLKKMKGE